MKRKLLQRFENKESHAITGISDVKGRKAKDFKENSVEPEKFVL